MREEDEPKGEHRRRQNTGRSYWDPSVEIGEEEPGAYLYQAPPRSAEDEYFASLEEDDQHDLNDALPLLDCLTPKQRWVMECRYGLRNDGEMMAVQEIAALLGTSHQAVLRIIERAEKTMRRHLRP